MTSRRPVVAALLVMVLWTVLAGPALAARDWTILLYLAGDNDLEELVLPDLDEREAGLPQGDAVEVIAFVDKSRSAQRKPGDWSGGRLYRLRPDQDRTRLRSEVLVEYGPLDMGSPDTVALAMREAFGRFPAPHRAMILWDHGGGWSSLAVDVGAPGAPGGRNALDLPKLAAGLRTGLQQLGLPRLDLIGFDMCLMGQLETAVEMQGLASYLVASQAVEPYDGWAYEALLGRLAGGPVSPRDLARDAVETYGDYFASRPEKPVTLSAIDLDLVPTLLAAFDRFWNALQPSLPTSWNEISRSLFWSTAYSPAGRAADLASGAHALQSVDLADAVERIGANLGAGFTARAEALELRAAIDRTVIANVATERLTRSHGLALYAPVRAAAVDPAYRLTRLARESRWPAFLNALHAEQQRQDRPPQIVSAGLIDAQSGQPTGEVALDAGAVLQTEVRGSNILSVTSIIGRDDPVAGGLVIEAIGFLVDTATLAARAAATTDTDELLAPAYAPGGARLTTDIAGISLLVAAGDALAQPTFDVSSLTPAGIPDIQALATLERSGQPPREVRVHFDIVTSKAVAISIVAQDEQGRMSFSMLRPQPSDRLTFLAFVQQPDGRTRTVPAGAALLWGQQPTIIQDLSRPGSYRMLIKADAIGGESRRREVTGRVRLPGAAMLAAIDQARRLEPASLVGTWSAAGGQPLLRFEPDAGNPAMLRTIVLRPDLAQELARRGLTSTTRLETRRLPSLIISHADGRGVVRATEEYVLLAVPGDPNRIRLRGTLGEGGDARGQLSELVRDQPPGLDRQQLVGRWQGRTASGSTLELTLDGTGALTQQEVWPQGMSLRVAGRWSFQDGQILVEVQQLDPAQNCAPQGQCQPWGLPPSYRLPVSLGQGGTLLELAGAQLRRAG